MEIITHERSPDFEVFVLKDEHRQVALVLRGGECVSAEVVGCLCEDEERGFTFHALSWLHLQGLARTERRSGAYEAYRPAVARLNATA